MKFGYSTNFGKSPLYSDTINDVEISNFLEISRMTLSRWQNVDSDLTIK